MPDRPSTHAARIPLVGLALAAPVLCVACSRVPTALVGGPVGPYDRPYPATIEPSEQLDVQVARDGPVITLTNTTARSFGPSTLWINRRYSRPIAGFEAGRTITLPLKQFRDEYGDAFRGGGFFATEQPDRVVMAELETTTDNQTVIYGLVVVGGQN
ncbi:MAG: hypothetical protein DYG93_09945 [Leptolyngbya sp. PLA2]|nr:hypothetical protein [Leptolyngbya sp.]MCE7971966.1 hypothetical protein [Leptolyngbya sp. PL-A2]MCQ3940900.1 hypothetical protein [cyanobacterium CYA1]MCZ7634062.1 hypothetical protein [Phycisphaerales bacterium]MDL1905214.1 hypothetical protein [Synechococcales cyanobacterium CNB]GIK19235.1 MAG: hypothetical protein BroJett004_13990 [Planctomycetota bacterium]